MAKSWSMRVGGVHLGTKTGPATQEVDPQAPFRILFLGDFSGRAGRSGVRPADWRPIRIDREDLETVLGRLGIEIHLDLPTQGPLKLRISEMEDFHPDRLYQRLPLFENLRTLRRRLQSPATFAAAAAEIRSWAATPAPAPPPTPAAPPEPAEDADLLELLLGEASLSKPRPSGMLEDYIREIVGPYALPDTRADEAALTRVVDDLATAHMRAILHHPRFKAVEAAWRSLTAVLRRLDDDGGVQLFLLDATREEVAADLSGEDLSHSRLHHVLIEHPLETPGGVPWAVLVGDFTFAPLLGEGLLLARLAHLARHAEVAFLAGAHPTLAGTPSLLTHPEPSSWTAPAQSPAGEVWQTLRGLPAAAYVGLALPRLLLRLPYGREGSQTEEFEFEEIKPESNHEDFLWGNPAFACALLLGQAYERMGWEMQPGAVRDLGGLPAFVRTVAGQREMLPCAEVLLRDKAANALMERGLIPLQSVHQRDVVRVTAFRSLAEQSRVLAGRWER